MERRQRGLLSWVVFSSGLTIRDLSLVAHGGGATPSWLLRAEIAALSLSATSGLAVLRSPVQETGFAASRRLKAFAAATGAAAGITHGVRLAIYLRARATKPR